MGVNMNIKDSCDLLLASRHIYIWGDIEDELAFDVTRSLLLLANSNKKPITILIHSRGGDLDSATAIIDEMKAINKSGIIVRTLAEGLALSAGAAILSQGTKGYRLARPNSSIMLHPCSIYLDDDYEGNQRSHLNFLCKKSKLLNKDIAKACGFKIKDYNKFLNDIDKGLWMTAEEAVKYGIIDGVYDKLLEFGGDDEEKHN
jgi:ATP-dependent Clp protease, protease subunit